MDNAKFKILNHYHVIFLIENVMVGVGLLSLPHDLSAVGYNLWLIPILLGLIAQVALYPMVRLGLKFPDSSLFAINEKVLGKWLGKLINFLLILYALLMITAVGETYLRLVQTIALPDRTITWQLAVLFGLAAYIVFGGIKSVARFCIMSFLFTGWMIYFLQWPMSKGEWEHLLPFATFRTSEVVETIHIAFPSMFGFELLMFYFPYIKLQKKAFRHASYGIWLTIFFYTVVCLASVVYFSPWQLEHLRYPVLNIFKAVELSWIERMENLGINLWVFLILTTLSGYLWMAYKGVGSLFNIEKLWIIPLCLVVPFIVVHMPFNQVVQDLLYGSISSYVGYGIILYPNFIMLISWIQDKRRTLT